MLAKDLKCQRIGMNIKQKVRLKIRQVSIDIFSNQSLLELLDCLFWFIWIKAMMLKDIVSKSIIYQKLLSKLLRRLSMEWTFKW